MTSTQAVSLVRSLLSRRCTARGTSWGASLQRAYCSQQSDKAPAEPSGAQLFVEAAQQPGPNDATARQALGSIRTGRDIAMVFTCKKCETRAVKTFSRQSYERGLVLVRCPSCEKLHLVADNLGWFGDKGFRIAGMDIRTLASQHPTTEPGGKDPTQGTISPEDLIGASKVQQLIDSVAAAEGSTGGVRESADGRGAEAHSPGASHLVLELTDPQGSGHSGVLQVSPEDAAAYARTRGKGA